LVEWKWQVGFHLPFPIPEPVVMDRSDVWLNFLLDVTAIRRLMIW
jgi:hypothetical protein